jgi:hypothetical protein
MSKLKPTLTLMLTLFVASIAAQAQTKPVRNGITTVELNSGFLSALSSLGVAPSPLGDSQLDGTTIDFPIVEGLLDESDNHAEIIHNGGLQLKAGGTVVELRDFTIDTTGSQPVITGAVLANGKLVGRAVLFDLSLSGAAIVTRGPLVLIENVQVTLAPGAAATLNSVFHITALAGGLQIGTADVVAIVGK